MSKRFTIGFVLIAALVIPASASAEVSPNDFKNAAKYCKALRAEIGVSTFGTRFGSNGNKHNAFGKCVSKQRNGKHGLVRAARSECQADYAADSAAFLLKYGEPAGSSDAPSNPGSGKPEGTGNPNSEVKQALARCVRAQVKARVAELLAALDNAAQTCKTERAAGLDAFRTRYGSNKNKHNAFGKCVLQHLKTGTEGTAPTS
jgi:hypothetical protein